MKVFISQPMKGKTEEEIVKERKKLIKLAEGISDEPIEIIDSYFKDTPKTEDNVVTDRVFYLGKSLQKLSEADAVMFGNGWETTSGCIIERKVCELYDIPILNFEADKVDVTNSKSSLDPSVENWIF